MKRSLKNLLNQQRHPSIADDRVKKKQYVHILCESADSLGGVETFVNSFKGIARRLGYKTNTVSRFYKDLDGAHFNSETEYLYPQNFRRLLDDFQNSTDKAVSNELREKLELSKQLAARRMRSLASRWEDGDVILVLQAGSLLELQKAVPAEELERFNLLTQYHGTFSYAAEQPYWTAFSKAIRTVDTFIALSNDDSQRFAKFTDGESIAIPNSIAIDTEFSAIAHRTNTAVYVGRLEPEKSVDEMLKAWQMARKRMPEGWNLDVYGTGSSHPDLVQLCSDLGIESSVTFHGHTATPKQIFAGAKMNLMSSHREGMPMSILEAQSVATPTVCYAASPGVSELVVQGQTGMLVEPGDVTGLADAIVELACDSSMLANQSVSAFRHVADYSQEKIDSLWGRALSKGKPSARPDDSRASTDRLGVIAEVTKTDGLKTPVRLTFALNSKPISPKSLVVSVLPTDSSMSEVEIRNSIHLPWSSAIGAPYIYLPAASPDTGVSELSFEVSSTVSALKVEVLRWGLRNIDPKSVIKSVYINTDYNVGAFRESGVMLPFNEKEEM